MSSDKERVENRHFFLKDMSIGISISESDNLKELGLGNSHLKDIMIETARYILAAGGNLAYGGDMRQGGFTELMFDLLKYYKNDEDLPAKRFSSYLSWPLSLKLSEDTQTSMINIVSFKKVLPPDNIDVPNINVFLLPNTPENSFIWANCLTKMRHEMENMCFARIFVGGRASGYKGKCPGILEELLIAIENRHPIYVIGAYGGVSKEVFKILNGDNSEILSDNFQLKDDTYSEFVNLYNSRVQDAINYKNYQNTILRVGIAGLAEINGLSIEDNIRLGVTPHIQEIVYLVLKGLNNIVR